MSHVILVVSAVLALHSAPHSHLRIPANAVCFASAGGCGKPVAHVACFADSATCAKRAPQTILVTSAPSPRP